MLLLAAHLAALYAGPLAVPAELGGVAARVFFDAPGSVEDGMVLESPSLRAQASTWPTAAAGQVVELSLPEGQRSFRIREILPLDDGAERRFVLAAL